MPIIKSAKKKMRKDKTRTLHNEQIKGNIKRLVKDARRNPSPDSLQKVFSALDKAAKVKFIHPNKAARLKSRLSKTSASA
jgi:small subunit ribosomal protein S20